VFVSSGAASMNKQSSYHGTPRNDQLSLQNPLEGRSGRIQLAKSFFCLKDSNKILGSKGPKSSFE